MTAAYVVEHVASVPSATSGRMSPAAVGLAVLLHALLALAFWAVMEYRPPYVPHEDPVEITFEAPKPPDPPKPEPPKPEEAQKPPPPAEMTPPPEGLRPPGEEADRRTQVRPSGDAPKDVAGPPQRSLEDELPKQPPEAAPPPPTETAMVAPSPPAPAPPPPAPAPPTPAPTPPTAPLQPFPKPTPGPTVSPFPMPTPGPTVTPPSPPRPPEPKPPEPTPPVEAKPQPQPPPPQPQRPQPTQPQHAKPTPPPPALTPNTQPRPSPLTGRPQQQPPAVARREEPSSTTTFVNPADERNRSLAQDNYLWEVVRKLRGYRYHANVPMKEGLTVVQVVIARDGRLLRAEVVRSSGIPAMDQGVLAGVRQGSPYTPLPSSISGPSATFRLPLVSVPDER